MSQMPMGWRALQGLLQGDMPGFQTQHAAHMSDIHAGMPHDTLMHNALHPGPRQGLLPEAAFLSATHASPQLHPDLELVPGDYAVGLGGANDMPIMSHRGPYNEPHDVGPFP